jgi:uncharacterized protein YndB with AHSA1/START domain
MARFTVQVPVCAPAQQVWDLVTDWTAHERWIPMTTVRILTASPRGAGARFVARTGLGPLSVDDVMEVTAWAPPSAELPGRFEVVKQGRLVHGGARFEVRNVTTRPGSLVTWTEELTLAPERLTWPLGPLIGIVGRLGLARALRTMANEFE